MPPPPPSVPASVAAALFVEPVVGVEPVVEVEDVAVAEDEPAAGHRVGVGRAVEREIAGDVEEPNLIGPLLVSRSHRPVPVSFGGAPQPQDAGGIGVIGAVGRRGWRVPKRLLRRMDESIELTRDNRGMTFTIAFNYGGRDEITTAVRKIVASGVKPEKVTEALIGRNLFTAGIPDPDLIIRTSGEMRTSNFLVWQASYAEYYFTPVLWPDFGPAGLKKAVAAFAARTRKFGGLAGS